MCGWLSVARVLASRSNRAFRSGRWATWVVRVLTATVRLRRVSRARYTSPIPPEPTSERISYGPSSLPAESVTFFVAGVSTSYLAIARVDNRPTPSQAPKSRRTCDAIVERAAGVDRGGDGAILARAARAGFGPLGASVHGHHPGACRRERWHR